MGSTAENESNLSNTSCETSWFWEFFSKEYNDKQEIITYISTRSNPWSINPVHLTWVGLVAAQDVVYKFSAYPDGIRKNHI
ncbi:3685_t:CDS:2 [Entrophospora sp. SA101]|nr:3685_t:CDS:2 [Entrophospora sp. SA101]